MDPEAPEVSTVVRGLDRLDDVQLQRLDKAEVQACGELGAELENYAVDFVDRPQQLLLLRLIMADDDPLHGSDRGDQ